MSDMSEESFPNSSPEDLDSANAFFILDYVLSRIQARWEKLHARSTKVGEHIRKPDSKFWAKYGSTFAIIPILGDSMRGIHEKLELLEVLAEQKGVVHKDEGEAKMAVATANRLSWCLDALKIAHAYFEAVTSHTILTNKIVSENHRRSLGLKAINELFGSLNGEKMMAVINKLCISGYRPTAEIEPLNLTEKSALKTLYLDSIYLKQKCENFITMNKL